MTTFIVCLPSPAPAAKDERGVQSSRIAGGRNEKVVEGEPGAAGDLFQSWPAERV